MAKFQLISQFLKDFSFESPNVPELFFKQENGQAKMDINLDIQIKGTENNIYMVDLLTKLHTKLDEKDKSMFMIESTYSGLVQIEKSENEEDLKKTLLIEVPKLLFPSVRAIILRITGESGFPPFAMQQIDFEKLYEEKNKK
ncbi:MAG: protein-export chaperone SecB [Alphaproteobacteria bacterium]|jgi:preprotein translocase subunit SecB|nr:protein-export chaperone SecB [Alphaproteobacteria bacterium]